MNEINTYVAPWLIYGLDWSNRKSNAFRLAISSFNESKNNKLQVLELDQSSDSLKVKAEADNVFPCSKLKWIPAINADKVDMFATSGDGLRLWEVDPQGGSSGISCKAALCNPKTQEFHAPLTSFDWNEYDASLIATSSVDTTCTIWNIETKQAKTQLIAHDKEVNDVAFAKGVDIFGTVGADGSVRMFDLRNLEHSTIIYETPDGSPLVRLLWNKLDTNYLATIKVFSDIVLILDIRMPCSPVTELRGHKKYVNHCYWSPKSAHHICTAGEDGQALVWDITNIRKSQQEPSLAYQADDDICQISWSSCLSEWVAITYKNTLQTLKI